MNNNCTFYCLFPLYDIQKLARGVSYQNFLWLDEDAHVIFPQWEPIFNKLIQHYMWAAYW